ncbi:hypothetical protein SAMN05421690_100390 [Nitrosomonas sp. Nm51]|nr:hypothetical protein SAMN05421690_100390 [Nitrosomonas sp. Nm51]
MILQRQIDELKEHDGVKWITALMVMRALFRPE